MRGVAGMATPLTRAEYGSVIAILGGGCWHRGMIAHLATLAVGRPVTAEDVFAAQRVWNPLPPDTPTFADLTRTTEVT